MVLGVKVKEEPMICLRSSDSSRAEETVVQLSPQQGGCITQYVTHAKDRSYKWLAAANENHPAAFAMVPFCSRIQHGRFTFEMRDIQLPANNPPEAHAIHGQGFQRPWSLVEAGDSHAAIKYEHASADWPWTYSVQQEIALTGRNLSVQMTVRNESENNMPLGMGLHPFFPKTQQTVVSANVLNLCQLDEQLLPVGARPLPVDLTLGSGLSLGTRSYDHVFTGWDGAAVINWPEAGTCLRIRAHHLPRYLVLWSPADADFVCVEPISNLPNAFNLPLDHGPGYSILAPGTSLAERWTFEPEIC